MKKKHIIIVVVILILASIMGGTYYFLTKQDSNTLTVLEKEWIKNNKNNMIDISILDNVPIFNYDGQGLINDFLDDVEKDTGLEFNRISYKKEENTEDNTEENKKYQIYQLAVEAGYTGTYEQWL